MSNLLQRRFAAGLLATAAFFVPSLAAACELAESGFGYIQVVDQGETWSYELERKGPSWRIQPFGWHAHGELLCESCPGYGLFHFMNSTGLEPYTQLERPATAAQRSERRIESFGYPPERLNPTDLKHFSSQENVSIGPLSGYVVQYRVAKESSELMQGNAIVVVSVADHCIAFATTILVRVDSELSAAAAIESLLREISLRRVRIEEARPPSHVRIRPNVKSIERK